ncbi:hypothetical protein Q8A67_006372 [Cirrhinus molitorella]|uniref:Fibronectin type-III domain-containing protein n=1 Tax=Cirrhinus molitorella TaxID=172907 RepID=A0AA88TSP4_9TELE|nr:hypothetical protein Q8A67_006372 [Cirrhinus molitorella]
MTKEPNDQVNSLISTVLTSNVSKKTQHRIPVNIQNISADSLSSRRIVLLDMNNRQQVNDLLQKIDSMIEQNGGGHYSNQMYEDALTFRREEEEQRQREEEQRKQQEEKKVQEEIERVRKETEERIRAEMKAQAESQNMASEPIELAALGRPLFPGMLYDCRKDSFIPGVTLWDKKSLREDLDSRLQLMTDLKFSSSDSLSSKASLLDVNASLKASFLGGLVEVGGSAKYLHNTKSSNQQSRVTMHYSETSKFEQLTMTQLGKITYPQVFDQKTATHVVTAVLYGAQAFMVFDRTFAEDESKEELEGELNIMVKKIPKLSIEGKGAVKMTGEDNKKAENITCIFHGDVHLEQNPTTYMEALEVYKKLPTLLKEKPQNAVPIKVWLYPLHLLDTKAAQLRREISACLISKTEDIMERLKKVERTCNDLSRRTELNVFSDIKTRLSSFQDSFSIYKMVLQKELARVLPAIRGGGMEEQSLEDTLKIHSSSPFNADLLNQWLDDAKSELYLLNNHRKSLNVINIEDSDGLNAILLDPNICVILCLTFTSLQYKDPYLSTLTEFLKSDKFKELHGGENPLSTKSDVRKWFKDPDVIAKMRENLSLFKRFSEANKNEKSIRFITSAIPDPSIPGSSIYLYENGKLTDTKFQPVSRPPAPVVKDVLMQSVSLKLQKSPTGETVKYRVEYMQVKADSGAEKQWLVKDTADEDFKLTGLKPGKQYLIRYRIVGKVGVSETSETLSPAPASTTYEQFGRSPRDFEAESTNEENTSRD